jgi:hypothetical protein
MRLTEAEFAAIKAARAPQPSQAETAISQRAAADQIAEAEIEAEITRFLTWKGIPFAFSKAEVGRGKADAIRAGWPDLTACHKGKFVAIEVKAPKGKLRKTQAQTLWALREADAIVVIARSVADVRAALDHCRTPDSTLAELVAALRMQMESA